MGGFLASSPARSAAGGVVAGTFLDDIPGLSGLDPTEGGGGGGTLQLGILALLGLFGLLVLDDLTGD